MIKENILKQRMMLLSASQYWNKLTPMSHIYLNLHIFIIPIQEIIIMYFAWKIKR